MECYKPTTVLIKLLSLKEFNILNYNDRKDPAKHSLVTQVADLQEDKKKKSIRKQLGKTSELPRNSTTISTFCFFPVMTNIWCNRYSESPKKGNLKPIKEPFCRRSPTPKFLMFSQNFSPNSGIDSEI